jgi:hypothetical protein
MPQGPSRDLAACCFPIKQLYKGKQEVQEKQMIINQQFVYLFATKVVVNNN